jgi:hypothetical protein
MQKHSSFVVMHTEEELQEQETSPMIKAPISKMIYRECHFEVEERSDALGFWDQQLDI